MRIGIDVGGTFTDIFCLGRGGVVTTRKVSSTVDDYSRSITEVLPELFEADGEGARNVHEVVVHGTTVATNAILQQNGAKTALITTRGFRDVMELRRIRMPELYNWNWDKPPDLVERRLRFEVDERIDAHGNVIRPIDPNEVYKVIDDIAASGVESVAICLINSYIEPAHELLIARLISERHLHISVSISSEILREVREYERTATTVVNAYILPLVSDYIHSFERSLQSIGVRAPLLVMQSNGGVMTTGECMKRPVFMIESGPAAGVIAGHALAQRLGLANAVTLDMGGTTTKASVIEGGKISTASEYEIGASLSLASRLIKGGGHLIRIPAIDVAEIGAGGGSIVWLDAAKALRIGPQSAGADPGPACYDRGGTEPTITDANLLLGYVNEDGLIGGSIRLNPTKAEEAVRKHIASPLGMEVREAAYGIHVMANSSMMRALRAVSTERGRDIRDFVQIAFGGSGPLHAVEMARALDMQEVIIPPHAGLFSASGLLSANVEYRLVQTYYRRTRELDLESVNILLDEMERRACAVLTNEGYSESDIEIDRHVDLRYTGQSYELTVPVRSGTLNWNSIASLEEHFDQEHEKTYGHRGDTERRYMLVNFRLTAGVRPEPLTASISSTVFRPRQRSRKAYFGTNYGLVETPVVSRADLTATPMNGPMLIDEYDTTTVVPPGCCASLDASGNIRIQIGVPA
jgi:N-methylhydantoinase A